MRNGLVFRLLFVFLAVSALNLVASAQDFGLTIGKHETIQSRILGEKRDILISEPKLRGKDFPLLIVIDEWNFRLVTTAAEQLANSRRLPPIVIVSVVNVDRGRDLTPIFNGPEFADGPADKFLSFLSDELIPHIASEYPIGKYRAILGHSNGGMFSLYTFMRRPELFHANLALSPAYGSDDRFMAQLAKAVAKTSPAQRFIFIGAGGDEEADIAVGALRFAKTFEASPSPDVEYHYESFPGETHGSVAYRAYFRALEELGAADPASHEGPARLLTEPQRRRRAWLRRFGSSFSNEPLPLYSVAKPLMEELGSGDNSRLAALWERLRVEHGDDFRFDPVERQNLLAALGAHGQGDQAAKLRALPGFEANGLTGNSYGQGVDLSAGLVANVPLQGSPSDLCHPNSKPVVKNAVPSADHNGKDGMAYHFSGSDSFIEIPWSADYSTHGSISVSAWVRARQPMAYTAWASQVLTNWGSQWRVGFGPNPTQWGTTSLATRWTDYLVNEPFPLDQWVHMAAVFDQTLGQSRLYLNGREVGSFNNIAPWTAAQGPLLIGGQRDDGLYFDGEVGEVRVYRRALNANEVAVLSKLESANAKDSACEVQTK